MPQGRTGGEGGQRLLPAPAGWGWEWGIFNNHEEEKDPRRKYHFTKFRTECISGGNPPGRQTDKQVQRAGDWEMLVEILVSGQQGTCSRDVAGGGISGGELERSDLTA